MKKISRLYVHPSELESAGSGNSPTPSSFKFFGMALPFLEQKGGGLVKHTGTINTVVARLKAISKIMMSTSVFPLLNLAKFRQVKVALIEAPDEDWFVNWALQSKIIEVNLSRVAEDRSGLQFQMNFAFITGLVYYDLCMKAPERKYWKLWIRKGKISLTIVNKLKFSVDILGKARAAWGVGWTSYCVRSSVLKKSPLRRMVGEFLHQFNVSENEQVTPRIDPKNPLGVELDPQRFQHIGGLVQQLQGEFTQQQWDQGVSFGGQSSRVVMPPPKAVYTSPEQVLDQAGIPEYVNAVLEDLRLNPQKIRKMGHTDFASMMSKASLTVEDNGNYHKISFQIRTGSGDQTDYYDVVQITRLLYADSMKNDMCFSNPLIQGMGLGVKMTGSQFKTALETGLKKIKTWAAGSSREAYPDGTSQSSRRKANRGYMVWPKFGFDQPVDHYTIGKEWMVRCSDYLLSEMGELDALDLFKKWFADGTGIPFSAINKIQVSNPIPSAVAPSLKEGSAIDQSKDILLSLLKEFGQLSEPLNLVMEAYGLPQADRPQWAAQLKKWLEEDDFYRTVPETLPVVTSVTEAQHQALLSDPTGMLTEDFRETLLEYLIGKKDGVINKILSYDPPPPMTGAYTKVGQIFVDNGFISGEQVWNMVNSEQGASPQELEMRFTKKFFVEFVQETRDMRDFKPWIAKDALGIRQQRLQNLMEICPEVGQTKDNCFPLFWQYEVGDDLHNASCDLSQGMNSIPILIMDLYRKKKIEQGKNFQRTRTAAMVADVPVFLTETGGDFLAEDLILIDEARDEVYAMLRNQKGKLASKWLSRRGHYEQ